MLGLFTEVLLPSVTGMNNPEVSTLCTILNICFVKSHQVCSQTVLLSHQTTALLCQHVRIGESRVRYVCLNVFGASVRWYRAALCHGVG